MHDALQHAFVRLRAERRQCERAGGAALVADRRHARLADRQLQVQRAEAGDDLGRGRPGRRAGGQRSPASVPARLSRRRRTRTRAASRARRRAIASKTARRRTRRSRSRCRRCVRAGRRWGTGGDMAGTVANRSSGFNRVNAQGSSARVPVEGGSPVPVGRADRYDAARSSIASVSAADRGSRAGSSWSGCRSSLVLAWVVATRVIHVVFLFLVAALVALLLDPLVRALQRVQLPPRPLGRVRVPGVRWRCSSLVILAVATVVVGQTKTAANRFNDYFTHRSRRAGQTSAYLDVDRLQRWLEPAPPEVDQGRAARPQARAADPRARRRQVHAPDRHVRRGRGDLDRQDAVRGGPRARHVDLHAPRLAAVRPLDRPAVPASTGRALAAARDGARARVVRARPGRAEPDHRDSAGIGLWVLGGDRPAAARAAVRAALRRLGRRSPRSSRTSGPGSGRSRRSSTRSSCTRSRRSGWRCSSSASTRSKGTSSCRT